MLSRYMCVQKLTSSWVQRFISYQQCTRFRTTLDFDREYPWNGSSNRQAENGVINYDLSTFGENNCVNFGLLTKKSFWPLTYVTLKLNRIRAVINIHVRAKYDQSKCSGSRVIVLTEIKTPTETTQSVATAESKNNTRKHYAKTRWCAFYVVVQLSYIYSCNSFNCC